jgi:hypothetical protein
LEKLQFMRKFDGLIVCVFTSTENQSKPKDH